MLCLFNFWKNNSLPSNIKQMVNNLTKVSTILRNAKEHSKVRLKKKYHRWSSIENSYFKSPPSRVSTSSTKWLQLDKIIKCILNNLENTNHSYVLTSFHPWKKKQQVNTCTCIYIFQKSNKYFSLPHNIILLTVGVATIKCSFGRFKVCLTC